MVSNRYTKKGAALRFQTRWAWHGWGCATKDHRHFMPLGAAFESEGTIRERECMYDLPVGRFGSCSYSSAFPERFRKYLVSVASVHPWAPTTTHKNTENERDPGVLSAHEPKMPIQATSMPVWFPHVSVLCRFPGQDVVRLEKILEHTQNKSETARL